MVCYRSFKPGLGREGVAKIFCLNSVLQFKLQKPRGKVYALFVDFKIAFPSIKHNLLWEKLSLIGINDKLINTMISIYQKAVMFVRNRHGTSEPIKITEGLLQG